MYLSQLKLWNFRKFGKPDPIFDLTNPHLSIDFNEGINLLVGENDSGKSAVIDAIKLLLRTHSIEWIRVEDDDFYQSSDRLRIESIFRGLEDNEAKHFVEWLGIETVTTPGGDLKKPFLRLILDVKRSTGKILPYDIKGGPDEDGRLVSSEARELLRPIFKALRDAKAELIARKNSGCRKFFIVISF
jgi:putative ATP-dependent endonuclease of OLD family